MSLPWTVEWCIVVPIYFVTMVSSLQTALVALLASSSALALPNPISHEVAKSDTRGHSHYVRDGLTLEGRATRETYSNEVVAGISVIGQWYNTSNGLWNDAWWNSANVITMLADFQVFAPEKISNYTSTIFPHTFEHAPIWGGFTGFINDFYDDELWWVLAWIQVFDVTDDQKYLDMASSIFEDSKKVWGEPPCGGL